MSKRKRPEHKGHVPATPEQAFVPLADLHDALAYPVDGLTDDDDDRGDGAPKTWQERGLCNQVDPELWFPEKGGSTREAKRICSGCPVRTECLDYALAHDERFGIWGGLSERERRRLRRPLADAHLAAAVDAMAAAA